MGDGRSARYDARRAKVKGHHARDSRRCVYCGKDATPRYLYCSDEHSALSREETTRDGRAL